MYIEQSIYKAIKYIMLTLRYAPTLCFRKSCFCTEVCKMLQVSIYFKIKEIFAKVLHLSLYVKELSGKMLHVFLCFKDLRSKIFMYYNK